MPRPLIVFAYGFPHRKTEDFLFELFCAGYRDVHVVAAPWKPLPHAGSETVITSPFTALKPHAPVDLCRQFGFSYHELEHHQTAAIEQIRLACGADLALIAGARILPRDVIDLFKTGIINFHPGRLPETAGLDLFFYTIHKSVPLGITVHFIDHRVDAGSQIFFEPTQIGPDDTPAVVTHNNYLSQIRALRKLLASMAGSAPLVSQPIHRPTKNQPMTAEQKQATLQKFPEWRAARVLEQRHANLLDACQGLQPLDLLKTCLDRHPNLLETRTAEGWTPLIVAAYHQNLAAVQELLARGANPNATGLKGTTVLMYAKTKFNEQQGADYTLLGTLVQAGADVNRCDQYGKTIFTYLQEQGRTTLIDWLSNHVAAESKA